MLLLRLTMGDFDNVIDGAEEAAFEERMPDETHQIFGGQCRKVSPCRCCDTGSLSDRFPLVRGQGQAPFHLRFERGPSSLTLRLCQFS